MKYRNYKWKNRTPEINGVKNAHSSTEKNIKFGKKIIIGKFFRLNFLYSKGKTLKMYNKRK